MEILFLSLLVAWALALVLVAALCRAASSGDHLAEPARDRVARFSSAAVDGD